jgi:hypothetical protein
VLAIVLIVVGAAACVVLFVIDKSARAGGRTRSKLSF